MTISHSKYVHVSHRCRVLTWLVLISSCAAAQVKESGADCSSPEVVWQRYIDAVGGDAALQQIHTRLAEVTESRPATYIPGKVDYHMYRFQWKAPHKVAFRSHTRWFHVPGRAFWWTSNHKFDGHEWSDSAKWSRQPSSDRPMSDVADRLLARVLADPLMFAKPMELYSSFKSSYDSKDPGLCVLQTSGPERYVHDRLYFDAQSGFLKSWTIQESPGGQSPADFEFDDYRQVGDVKFPFYIHLNAYHTVFRYTKVVHNLPLADLHFVGKSRKLGAP